MKIVVAPDKFKHSLSASKVTEAIATGIKETLPNVEVIQLPLADGGEGTIEILQRYVKCSAQKVKVLDPLFRPIDTSYLISQNKKTALIEVAKASGLDLLADEEKNCSITTSYGTGEMIKDAVEQGVNKIVLALGGSATNDAGIGIAAALGYRFLDENEKELKPIGKNLLYIRSIDDSKKIDISSIKVVAACDVTNRFYGKQGAAYVYAPQKGASAENVIQLDNGLRNFAQIVKDKYQVKVNELKRTGAAGGIGAGSKVFLNASLVSGIDLLMEYSKFEKHLTNTDFVVTGEGKIDNQTQYGKVVAGVVNTAQKNKIPTIALCGTLELSPKEIQDLGLLYATSILKSSCSLEVAYKNAFLLLKEKAQDIFRFITGFK